MKIDRWRSLWTLVTLLSAYRLEAQMITPLPSKKVLEFGWDMPSPAYYRDNLKKMERAPFDGVMFKLPDSVGGGNVFDVKAWEKTTEAARQEQLQIISNLPKSAKFTHNFVVIYGASTMDWFSDADWKKVLENARYCARLAKASGCKGVCWDAEPYGGRNPWRLKEQPDQEKRAFADYEKQARKRGAQFLRAIQEEFPGLVFMSLRMLSDFQDGSPFSQPLFPVRDVQARAKALQNAWWGIHPAFINGLLDAAKPGVRIIDGNEDAYYYTSELDFYRIFYALKRDAKMLVAPELHGKFDQHYQVSHAVSMDYTFGRWAEGISFPDYLRKQALELTPEQRVQWFEHNVYHALATAEEYIWVYGEDLSWWDNKNIPAGYEEAIRRAKRKYEAGQPLGFTVEAMLTQARERLKAKAKP